MKTLHTPRIQPSRPLAISLLAISLLAAAMPASAQPTPVRQVVPYSGHLDRDGAPFDGQAALRFAVYGQPADGEALRVEVHQPVNVRDGRFAVRLGEAPAPDGQPSIVDLTARGDQLYLELSVGPPAAEGVEPEWTRLSGRQAIHPVPQAVWSAAATDLAVARLHHPDGDDVVVDDDLVVNGVTSMAGRAVVSGPLWVQGDVSNNEGDTVTIADNLAVTGRTLAQRGLEVSGADLVVQRAASVGGRLNANGGLAVTGDLTQSTIRRDGSARHNVGDQETRPIGNAREDTHVCFIHLIGSRFDEFRCQVRTNNGRWELVTRFAECEASCIRVRP